MLIRLRATTYPTNEVKHVSRTKPFPSPGRGRNVVVVDFGLKHGILRELTERGCDIMVVPFDTPAEEILSYRPDGILLSNGPGNPENLLHVCEMIQIVQKQIPVFGIGLGHQLFALANGCQIEKMTFGHRGTSYPVKDLSNGKVIFTSQNHGYEVVGASIDPSVLSVTYQALNGNSIEGLKHIKLPAISVQFQPEAAPGSEDGKIVFDQFMRLMNGKNLQEEGAKQHA